MAKYKLTFKNLFTVVIAFIGSFVSTTVSAQANDVETEDTQAPKAAGKDAKKEASGSLSAGAIAAAVAAAAALAAVIDSGDGGGAAPVPTPAPTPAPTTAPAPTPAPTETYEYSYYVPTVVNVNTNTNTSTTTVTLAAYAQAGVFLPNVNTNTNTNTNTTTDTLARYVTNTNTNTNTTTQTSTNTNTSTNTTTNTVTSTYGTDASGDGFLQFAELTFDGSGNDFLPVDANEAGSSIDDRPNFYRSIDQVDIELEDLVVEVQLFDFEIGGGDQQLVGYSPLVVEVPIFNESYRDWDAADAFYGLDNGTNLSVDDNYVTDLGNNGTILEVLGDGFVVVQQDMLLNVDQEFAQDLLYLLEDLVIDDLAVEINQTYTAQVLKTETRTRLVGE